MKLTDCPNNNNSLKNVVMNNLEDSASIVEQKLALIKLIRVGDRNAKQGVVISYLELVADIAKRYKNSGDGSDDKIVQCCFSIIHALENDAQDGHIPDFLFT